MLDYPVQVRFPIHWGEMDAFGHVNNTRYFVWFETARIATFEQIGIAADANLAIGPILASTSCDFLIPLRYPGEVVVGARVPRIGNTSFVMEYAVALADAPERLCARGSGVVVMVDYRTGAKVRVPDAIREGIAALVG